jgi:hypothetical protein
LWEMLLRPAASRSGSMGLQQMQLSCCAALCKPLHVCLIFAVPMPGFAGTDSHGAGAHTPRLCSADNTWPDSQRCSQQVA